MIGNVVDENKIGGDLATWGPIASRVVELRRCAEQVAANA
jgi:hypothetical protein